MAKGGRRPRRPVRVPGRRRAYRRAAPGLSNRRGFPYCADMVTREEILVLGLTAGVVGSLVGGLMLGVGLGMAVQGAHIGWLLVLPAAPVSGLLGYLLARKLAKKL